MISGPLALDFADDPFPEDEGLGVGIVHAEDGDAHVHPELQDRLDLLPEVLAILAEEVEGIDVLVPLGRVLGALDGPVLLAVVPVRMVLHVGMVRRAVEGEVQGHLEAAIVAGGDEGAAFLEGSQLRVHGLVAAVRVADGVRAAGLAGLGHERIVGPLALGHADGVDGRQVDHVEAHGLDVLEAIGHVREGGAAEGILALRAGPHLVPGAVLRLRRIDPQLAVGLVLEGRVHERDLAGVGVAQGAGLDGELVFAGLVGRELAAPQVVVDELHGGLLPLGLRLRGGTGARPRISRGRRGRCRR